MYTEGGNPSFRWMVLTRRLTAARVRSCSFAKAVMFGCPGIPTANLMQVACKRFSGWSLSPSTDSILAMMSSTSSLVYVLSVMSGTLCVLKSSCR